MKDMQYASIKTQDDDMEFIISRNVNSDLYPVNIVEAGHSRPKCGKRADSVTSCFQLHFVTGGKGLFRDKPVEKGTLFLVISGEPQNMSVESCDFEQYWINFRGDGANRLLTEHGIAVRSHILPICRDKTAFDFIVSLFESVFPHCENDTAAQYKHSNAYLMGLLFQIFSVCDSVKNAELVSSESYSATVCSYIGSRYTEKLTVELLSAVVGLSSKHLIRIFKKHTGKTLMQYVEETRIDNAAVLLRSTNISIGEIANASGYEDALYFSKVFRKRFGVSPSEYRKKHTVNLPDQKCK